MKTLDVRCVRVYLTEHDKYQRLLARLHDVEKVRGVTVFRGISGFGKDGHIHSAQLIDTVLDLRRKHERVVCLMGNHERMFLNWLDGREEDLFLANGGRNTLRSYGIVPDDSDREAKVPADHLEFFRSLLPFYETETHLFVHAGVRPGLPMEIQDPHDMIWIRHEFFLADHGLNKTVVFGHTPFTGKPYVGEKRIGIDTGAVYGGTLTCLELPAMKFHQV